MWLDDERTALYRFYGEGGALLYVGITANLESRWLDHERLKPWWPQVARKTFEWHEDRPAALKAELAAIKTERPVHNVVGIPWSQTRRALDPEEVGVGALRANLSEHCNRAQFGGEATFVVDISRQRKRVAALVSMDFYDRALAALGEVRVPAAEA